MTSFIASIKNAWASFTAWASGVFDAIRGKQKVSPKDGPGPWHPPQ